MTPLQQDERDAMTGDRAATIRVVSALRSYRELVAGLRRRASFDGHTELLETETEVDEIEGAS